MIALTPGAKKAVIAAASVAAFFIGALVGSVGGTAYALHWPLSIPNLEGALTFACLLGVPACAATTWVAVSVQPKWAIVPLVFGATAITKITGVVTFVTNAAAAAC